MNLSNEEKIYEKLISNIGSGGFGEATIHHRGMASWIELMKFRDGDFESKTQRNVPDRIGNEPLDSPLCEMIADCVISILNKEALI